VFQLEPQSLKNQGVCNLYHYRFQTGSNLVSWMIMRLFSFPYLRVISDLSYEFFKVNTMEGSHKAKNLTKTLGSQDPRL
jgi:hypothetical protein